MNKSLFRWRSKGSAYRGKIKTELFVLSND